MLRSGASVQLRKQLRTWNNQTKPTRMGVGGPSYSAVAYFRRLRRDISIVLISVAVTILSVKLTSQNGVIPFETVHSLPTASSDQREDASDAVAPPTGRSAFNAFNTHNPNARWCPLADCRNSPACQPCQRRFLLLIATGRSGSTSLLRMLDLLPGVRMGGENYNHLRAIRTMIEHYPRGGGSSGRVSAGAFQHEEIVPGALACPAQLAVQAIVPPPREDQAMDLDDSNTIIGFKTIRFFLDDEKFSVMADEAKQVEFVKRYFPCSRVVINIRSDTMAQSKSNWWRSEKNSSDVLADMNNRLVRAASLFGPMAHLVRFEEWTDKRSGTAKMKELARWLGFENCTYSKVLHDNIKDLEMDKTEISLGPHCRYVGHHFEPYGSLAPEITTFTETVTLHTPYSRFTIPRKFSATNSSVYFLASDSDVGPMQRLWWGEKGVEGDILSVPMAATDCKGKGEKVIGKMAGMQTDGTMSMWQMRAGRPALNRGHSLSVRLESSSLNPWLDDPRIKGCTFISSEPILIEARRWHSPNAEALLGKLVLDFVVTPT